MVQYWGDQNTNYTLAKSSIDLISLDSLETILELIDQNSLYRGEEFESLVKSYLDFRKSLTNLSPTLVDMKCFELGIKKGGVARFKNTVIGTLATDLSEGVELDKAVASFESKVAPTNYKRTTALITPKMIKQAQEQAAKQSQLKFLKGLRDRKRLESFESLSEEEINKQIAELENQ